MFTTRDSGKLIACAKDSTQLSCKWYGIMYKGCQVPKERVLICEFCAEHAFRSKELYAVPVHTTHAVYECDMFHTNLLLEYGYDRRCIHYNGLRINVNHVSPRNSDFRPTTLQQPKTGQLVVKLPTGAYWELAIKADPTGFLGDGSYYMKFNMIHANKIVETPTDYIQIPSGVPFKTNNFKSHNGYNRLFQFDNNSRDDENTFEIDISVYHKTMIREIYDSNNLICRGLVETDGAHKRTDDRPLISNTYSLIHKCSFTLKIVELPIDTIASICKQLSAIDMHISTANSQRSELADKLKELCDINL